VEAQNGSIDGLSTMITADSHHFDEEQDPIRIRINVNIWIRTCIKEKREIRIRIKAILIRNPSPANRI
jgi:hypothetical protein